MNSLLVVSLSKIDRTVNNRKNTIPILDFVKGNLAWQPSQTLFTFDIEKNFEALIPPVAPLLAKCRVDPSQPIQVTLLKDEETKQVEQVQVKPSLSEGQGPEWHKLLQIQVP